MTRAGELKSQSMNAEGEGEALRRGKFAEHESKFAASVKDGKLNGTRPN